jgi:Predicted esterase
MALITVDFFSKSLMRTVTINAIVPIDKHSFNPLEPKREEKPYKTLYLLHGIFGNHTDWVVGTRIQRWAQDNNLVIIMPSGENKFYVDSPNGEKHGEFIGQELVDITRKLFPLSNKYEDTYIAGLSMGGYGAIINGLKYHETFSHIAALSSALVLDNIINATDFAPFFTHTKSYFQSIFGDLNKIIGSNNDYNYLITNLIKNNKTPPKIYLACGTEDFLIKENRTYHQLLKELNVLVDYKEGPGAHDWDFWDQYILDVLNWLPLEKTTNSTHSGNVGR